MTLLKNQEQNPEIESLRKEEQKSLDLLRTLCDLAGERAEYMDAGEEQDEAFKLIGEAYDEITKAMGFQNGAQAHTIYVLNNFREDKQVLVEVTDYKNEKQGFDAVILPDGRIVDLAAEDNAALLMVDRASGKWDRNWGTLTLPFMTTAYKDEIKGKLALEAGYLSVASPFVEIISEPKNKMKNKENK